MTTNKDNMKIWDALGKTDPAHTKQFTRVGGFKGTAIKPMWANQQMTEFFGPCGIGWGPEEPRFNVVPAGEEIMVYCTVGLWYMYKNTADEWERGRVYGQGGDKVISQIFLKDSRGQKIIDEAKGGYKTYPQTDDEAFKKAYTDALSNAMKFIGVGADVHMGQFDDNKYVQQVGQEFEEQKRAEVFAEVERQKSNVGPRSVTIAATPELTMPETLPPELDWSYNKASGVLICRVVDVKVAKTKGAKPKEYVAVKINQQIDGKDMAFYWHESHKAELLAAKGKICKFLTLFTDKGFLNIDMLLEVDGRLMTKDQSKSVLGDKPLGDPETQARLLGSVLSFDDEDLREVHAHHNGDWAKVVAHLKDLKQRKDEGSVAV